MRSMLFVPAANDKALAKSASLSPDAFIFDLEDSTVGAQKDAARQRLKTHLTALETRHAQTLVRINAADSDHFDADVALITDPALKGKIQGVVLPKVDNAAQIIALESYLSGIQMWAMIETPLGVLNAEKIAASSASLAGFIVGLEDLSARLGISVTADRSNVSFALQKIVLAAKAFDMLAIDSVCKSYKNVEVLQREASQALDLGFDGKSLIHPSQIGTANHTFGVSAEALEQAHKLIDAFEAALEGDQSVATLDGQMIEELHFEAAKRLVLKHRSYEG